MCDNLVHCFRVKVRQFGSDYVLSMTDVNATSKFPIRSCLWDIFPISDVYEIFSITDRICVKIDKWPVYWIKPDRSCDNNRCDKSRGSVCLSGLIRGYLSRPVSVQRWLVASQVTCRDFPTSDHAKTRLFCPNRRDLRKKIPTKIQIRNVVCCLSEFNICRQLSLSRSSRY